MKVINNVFSEVVRGNIDLKSNILNLAVGVLKAGTSSIENRHNYESVMYIVSGEGKTYVNGEGIDWSAGDILHIPSLSWHKHIGKGSEDCKYFVVENMALLDTLGDFSFREDRVD